MANQQEVEVREDEEQSIKSQETIDLLVAAGYFRARIKGLSPFDKVVGGMTWCIETCNVDVDVRLLFQDNLSIGQKIALTEKIVIVLPKLKCPHRLEPHQIQGLDFIHIFPVVQWLVKRAIEVREETGDYVRAYSVSQFNKSHKTPEDISHDERRKTATGSVASLLDVYRPKRRFRRHEGHKIEGEEARVQSTLLEYGKKQGLIQLYSSDKSASEPSEKTQTSQDQESEYGTSAPEQRLSAVMGNMAALEASEKLSANVVGSIVALKSEEIRQMALDDSVKVKERASLRPIGGVQQRQGIIKTLLHQVDQLQASNEEASSRCDMLQKSYVELRKGLQEFKSKNDDLEKKLHSLNAMENEENQSTLKKLHGLVAMNESLKKQEQEFRAHCKEEMSKIQSSLEKLKSTHAVDDHEDHERYLLIEKHYQADKEKLQKLRLLLAKKNREIATVQRKIDEVPTRAELSQYQQRFFELYNQVAAKHKETKQFYTLYNTLDDTKLYLTKEVNLLNSISDVFSDAMNSPGNKSEFLKQFEGIVEGIHQNKLKLEKRKQEEKMRRDQLNDTYLDLIEKQRVYFKTVKDFKEECRKNEALLGKLKANQQ